MLNDNGPWVLYDGKCPFCSSYVKMVRLRDSVGPVRLINARDGGPELDELRAAGLDINEGMALKLNGRLYYGQACIQRIALLSTTSGVFNKLNAWIFRSEARSRALYPILRACRNFVLRMLGRSKIGAGNA